MPNRNCSSVICSSSRLFWTLLIIFISTCCSWWCLCLGCRWFGKVWSSNLLLCCPRFHILIVSSATPCCLRLIRCRALSVLSIILIWTSGTVMLTFISSAHGLWVMPSIRQSIRWIVWIATIFVLFSIHYQCLILFNIGSLRF